MSSNYMWGTTGIGYNVDKINERMPDAPVDSWAMIFDPEVVSKFADCGVHVLDSADDMLPAALNYLGLNPDSKDPAELQQAGDLLKTVRPLHPEIPLVRIHQRARERRYLPGRRLFRRRAAGARPRGRGGERRRPSPIRSRRKGR